jgi:hypothetical protein
MGSLERVLKAYGTPKKEEKVYKKKASIDPDFFKPKESKKSKATKMDPPMNGFVTAKELASLVLCLTIMYSYMYLYRLIYKMYKYLVNL